MRVLTCHIGNGASTLCNMRNVQFLGYGNCYQIFYSFKFYCFIDIQQIKEYAAVIECYRLL